MPGHLHPLPFAFLTSDFRFYHKNNTKGFSPLFLCGIDNFQDKGYYKYIFSGREEWL